MIDVILFILFIVIMYYLSLVNCSCKMNDYRQSGQYTPNSLSL